MSIMLVISALYIFIRDLHRAKGDKFKAYVLILIGTTLMFGFIIVFNFILPALFSNSKYLPFGALFTFPFVLFTTYGIPYELTEELAKEKNLSVDKAAYDKEMEEHQRISRTAAKDKFKGGLADHSEKTIMGHTATHLLHQALRDVF